jgi:hypothetical protein
VKKNYGKKDKKSRFALRMHGYESKRGLTGENRILQYQFMQDVLNLHATIPIERIGRPGRPIRLLITRVGRGHFREQSVPCAAHVPGVCRS